MFLLYPLSCDITFLFVHNLTSFFVTFSVCKILEFETWDRETEASAWLRPE